MFTWTTDLIGNATLKLSTRRRTEQTVLLEEVLGSLMFAWGCCISSVSLWWRYANCFAANCCSRIIRASQSKKLNKLLCSPKELIMQRKMLQKLLNTKHNTAHPLHNVTIKQQSVQWGSSSSEGQSHPQQQVVSWCFVFFKSELYWQLRKYIQLREQKLKLNYPIYRQIDLDLDVFFLTISK